VPTSEVLHARSWGYLHSTKVPFESMVDLDGEHLVRAILAIEFWLSSFGYVEDNTHIKKTIQSAFTNCSNWFRDAVILIPDMARFRLLQVLFDALIVVDPFYAGKYGVESVCKVVDSLSLLYSCETSFRRRWDAQCIDTAKTLSHWSGYADKVADGAKERRSIPTFIPDAEINGLVLDALGKMGVWRDGAT